MINLPDFSVVGSPLAIVLHDAGAANLIMGWLKSGLIPDVQVHVGGPAEILWRNNFASIETTSLIEALSGANALLCGTGWASKLEYQAMAEARALGIPIYAAVDHWANYRQRFLRDGVEILPNEVWVSDNYALLEAGRQLPEVKARVYENFYLRDQVSRVLALTSISKSKVISRTTRVLYALEPIREFWSGGDARPGEFQALDYFLSQLFLLGLDETCEIRLRPHPSDPAGKYDEWIAKAKRANVRLAPDESISEAIAWADIVAGCESFVLIIGLNSGRKVVSTLPPWANKIRLPHEGILRLNELKAVP